jgi:hypothetical protein
LKIDSALDSNAGIDLTDQCGWHPDVPNASAYPGRSDGSDIGAYATANSDQKARSANAKVQRLFANRGDLIYGFKGLGAVQYHHPDSVVSGLQQLEDFSSV